MMADLTARNPLSTRKASLRNGYRSAHIPAILEE